MPAISSTARWRLSTTTSRSAPRTEARLQRLAASGRIAFGPWYVLMDEFLVSGETIVRNLQLGLERAAEFGGAMEVGYLPDMFGHVGQMPQLLRQAGFADAVVWRGVPAAVDKTAFLVGFAGRLGRAGRVPSRWLLATAPRWATTPRRLCGGSTPSRRRTRAS